LADTNIEEASKRKLEKTDFNSVINSLRIRPLSKSRLSIPICRLEPLPLVRPILEFDVQLLENEFLNGYREGDRVLYVSIVNDRGESLCVTEDKLSSWGPIWQQANDVFEESLSQDEDLKGFKGKMFWVWEGNHRVTAWRRHIDKVHADEEEWHYSVDCICLNAMDATGVLLDAMNDVNR